MQIRITLNRLPLYAATVLTYPIVFPLAVAITIQEAIEDERTLVRLSILPFVR